VQENHTLHRMDDMLFETACKQLAGAETLRFMDIIFVDCRLSFGDVVPVIFCF